MPANPAGVQHFRVSIAAIEAHIQVLEQAQAQELGLGPGLGPEVGLAPGQELAPRARLTPGQIRVLRQEQIDRLRQTQQQYVDQRKVQLQQVALVGLPVNDPEVAQIQAEVQLRQFHMEELRRVQEEGMEEGLIREVVLGQQQELALLVEQGLAPGQRRGHGVNVEFLYYPQGWVVQGGVGGGGGVGGIGGGVGGIGGGGMLDARVGVADAHARGLAEWISNVREVVRVCHHLVTPVSVSVSVIACVTVFVSLV